MTHVRATKSSGSEEQDMIAIRFATNHRCIQRNSDHCDVKGGATLAKID